MTDDLADRFVSALGTGGSGTGRPELRSTVAAMLARYDEPHRRHHTREHLADMLAALHRFSPGPLPPAVVWAVLFHDVVYDPRAADNEQRSAALAAETLRGLGRPVTEVTEVVRLIGLTETHRPPVGDADGALLSDADLWILATPSDRYARYATSVRLEYAHLPEPAFRRGRVDALRTLLDAGPLFHTVGGRQHLEPAARANVTAEIDRLIAGTDANPRPAAG